VLFFKYGLYADDAILQFGSNQRFIQLHHVLPHLPWCLRHNAI